MYDGSGSVGGNHGKLNTGAKRGISPSRFHACCGGSAMMFMMIYADNMIVRQRRKFMSENVINGCSVTFI